MPESKHGKCRIRLFFTYQFVNKFYYYGLSYLLPLIGKGMILARRCFDCFKDDSSEVEKMSTIWLIIIISSFHSDTRENIFRWFL